MTSLLNSVTPISTPTSNTSNLAITGSYPIREKSIPVTDLNPYYVLTKDYTEFTTFGAKTFIKYYEDVVPMKLTVPCSFSVSSFNYQHTGTKPDWLSFTLSTSTSIQEFTLVPANFNFGTDL